MPFVFVADISDFLWHVAPAFTGALTAAIISGWFLQNYFVARANEAAFIDFLIEQLDQLRADGFEYWMLDVREGSSAEKKKLKQLGRCLEVKLKGAVKSVTAALGDFKAKYECKTDFDGLMMDVSDACTGGNFESDERPSDPSRNMVIINAINRVKSELLRRKV